MNSDLIVKIAIGVILSIGASSLASSELNAATKTSKFLEGQEKYNLAESLPKVIGPKASKSLVDANWKRAAKLYFEACMKGFGKSCQDAAFYANDYLQASTALHRGCYILGDSETCGFGGLFFSSPEGFVDKDISPTKKGQSDALSKKYYSRGCAINDGSSCAHIGFGHWLKKRFKQAEQVLKKSCDLKSIRGCNHLAHFYFNSYATRKKGISVLRYSCKIGSMASCTTLGSHYLGLGKIGDAKLLLTAACGKYKKYKEILNNSGNNYACYHLARLENKLGNYSKAHDLHKSLCLSWKYGKACSAAIDTSWAIKGTKSERALLFKEAKALFNSGCSGGDNESCHDLITLNKKLLI